WRQSNPACTLPDRPADGLTVADGPGRLSHPISQSLCLHLFNRSLAAGMELALGRGVRPEAAWLSRRAKTTISDSKRGISMNAQMRIVRRLLPFTLACGLLAALTPAARAAPLDIVPGFRITPPPGWKEGDRTRNSFDLVKVSPRGDVLALTQVTTEEREGHEEALERLADIVAEVPEPAQLLVIHGWPAIDRRSTATLSSGDQYQLPGDLSSPPDQTVVVRTVAMAAGPTLVRFETTLVSGAEERLLDEMWDSIEQMDVAAPGDPVRAQGELRQVARGVEVRKQEQQPSQQTPLSLEPAEAPVPDSASKTGAQPAAAVGLGRGELQIEATAD